MLVLATTVTPRAPLTQPFAAYRGPFSRRLSAPFHRPKRANELARKSKTLAYRSKSLAYNIAYLGIVEP